MSCSVYLLLCSLIANLVAIHYPLSFSQILLYLFYINPAL